MLRDDEVGASYTRPLVLNNDAIPTQCKGSRKREILSVVTNDNDQKQRPAKVPRRRDSDEILAPPQREIISVLNDSDDEQRKILAKAPSTRRGRKDIAALAARLRQPISSFSDEERKMPAKATRRQKDIALLAAQQCQPTSNLSDEARKTPSKSPRRDENVSMLVAKQCKLTPTSSGGERNMPAKAPRRRKDISPLEAQQRQLLSSFSDEERKMLISILNDSDDEQRKTPAKSPRRDENVSILMAKQRKFTSTFSDGERKMPAKSPRRQQDAAQLEAHQRQLLSSFSDEERKMLISILNDSDDEERKMPAKAPRGWKDIAVLAAQQHQPIPSVSDDERKMPAKAPSRGQKDIAALAAQRRQPISSSSDEERKLPAKSPRRQKDIALLVVQQHQLTSDFSDEERKMPAKAPRREKDIAVLEAQQRLIIPSLCDEERKMPAKSSKLEDDDEALAIRLQAEELKAVKGQKQTRDDALLASLLQQEEIASKEDRKKAEDESMRQSLDGRAWLFVNQVLDLQRKLSSSAPGLSPVSVDDMVFLTKRFLQCQADFQANGLPSHVSIAYHYTRSERMEDIKEVGLMTLADRKQKDSNATGVGVFGDGVYTSRNPYAFHGRGDVGLLVAVLLGNTERVTGNGAIATLGINTKVGNKTNRQSTDIVEADKIHDELILQESRQCLPLVRFDTTLISLIDDNDAGNDAVWAHHQELQKLLDQFLNGGTETTLKRILPSEGIIPANLFGRTFFTMLGSPTTKLTHRTSASQPAGQNTGSITQVQAARRKRPSLSSNGASTSAVPSVAAGMATAQSKKSGLDSSGGSPTAIQTATSRASSQAASRALSASLRRKMCSLAATGASGPVVQSTAAAARAKSSSAAGISASGSQTAPSLERTGVATAPGAQAAPDAQSHGSSSMDIRRGALCISCSSPVAGSATASTSKAASTLGSAGGATAPGVQAAPAAQSRRRIGRGARCVSWSAPAAAAFAAAGAAVGSATASASQAASTLGNAGAVTASHARRAAIGVMQSSSAPNVGRAILLRYQAPASLVTSDVFEASSDLPDPKEECAICMDVLEGPHRVRLKVCGHEYHRNCIEGALNTSRLCPVCRRTAKKPQGHSPSGKMLITTRSVKCSGFESSRSIVIAYSMPSGIQMPYHENPGQRYHGAKRMAFLPDNEDGRKLLKRLKYAFMHGLTFRIGTSLTTGQENRVTWSSIHHKTHPSRGAHGFPDPGFFANCHEELNNLGVPESPSTW